MCRCRPMLPARPCADGAPIDYGSQTHSRPDRRDRINLTRSDAHVLYRRIRDRGSPG
ncbi:hypothetical protein CBM2587_A170086 [Cupriavidus taiwanensis]|uniref:Uncharacterized protein n=1 Tax=Cupriavidus taiwanensis TaxID=164546 RepID=A0A975WY44_9BURK|nr:hypothetical protein CBM2587_A170086 [Cupriavidus taiwanensis]